MTNLKDAIAMTWGGDKNLAVRAGLHLPLIGDEPEPPIHKCWVDQEGVVWYMGPDHDEVASLLTAAGLRVERRVWPAGDITQGFTQDDEAPT